MLSHFSHVPLSATPWTVPARLLCPWDSPGNNTGVVHHDLLQRIFLTQGSNTLTSPALASSFFTSSATWEAQKVLTHCWTCLPLGASLTVLCKVSVLPLQGVQFQSLVRELRPHMLRGTKKSKQASKKGCFPLQNEDSYTESLRMVNNAMWVKCMAQNWAHRKYSIPFWVIIIPFLQIVKLSQVTKPRLEER